MPTTGTVLAKNMKLYAPTTALTCQVNASISFQTEMFDTTCKDSTAWSEQLPGTKSWTASGTGNLAFDAANGFEELFASWTAQTSLAIIFQTAVTGDKKYSGTTYISSGSLTSDGNDNPVTWEFEFTGTGALTEGTVS
jgi:predicted secreted protein